eukprot:1951913-Rhodomonas_salina.1
MSLIPQCLSASCLPACYEISSTDAGYGATISPVLTQAMVLRGVRYWRGLWCYESHVGYAATRPQASPSSSSDTLPRNQAQETTSRNQTQETASRYSLDQPC